MKSENAKGVFSDSLAIDHFTSSFPGSSLFLARVSPLVAAAHPCIQIKSALMVGHPLNFIISNVQFYLKKEEPDCFSLANGAHVLSRLQFLFYLLLLLLLLFLFIFFFFATDVNGYPPAQRTYIYIFFF